MKIEQRVYGAGTGWEIRAGSLSGGQPHLVLVFGARYLLQQNQGLDQLRETYPTARIVSASTSDAIVNTDIVEDKIIATAMAFDKAQVSCAVTPIADSYIAGPSAVLTGFYSYGELAPTGASAAYHLHNQTMSITSLREV